MFEFAASSILGAKRFVGVNENQETETLLRQNYTIEELESMQFVGEEQPLIKRNGVMRIRLPQLRWARFPGGRARQGGRHCHSKGAACLQGKFIELSG